MLLALLFSLIFLNSCSHVQIANDLWCADAGRFGAECFYTLSDGEVSLNKFQWDQLRLGQICTGTPEPGAGYIHIKNAIEKLCADTDRCTLEQRQTIEGFTQRAERAMNRWRVENAE